MRASVLLFVPFFTACTEAAIKKVNANPDAVITSHVDGDTVREGEPELLTGQVADADNDNADLTVRWTVAGSEVCPDSTADSDGAVSCEATFGADGGTVILTVSDPAGAGASATVDLAVQATDAPVADLTEPTATGRYYADQSIAFRGTVSDTEDSAEDLTITIETDELGDLGLELEVTSEGDVEAFGLLPEGEHAVRLRVVDTDGKEGIDSNIITVGPANSAPTCTITAPEDSSTGAVGDEVRFEGTANDPDVAADALTASWESDIDGPLREITPDSDGTIAFATNELTASTHRIKLTVADELGETCTTSIFYTVGTPPTVTITAPDDGDTVSAEAFVIFEAVVNDTEDAETDLNLRWDIGGEVLSEESADSDGAASFTLDGKGTDAFMGGTHVFTLTVTDTDGLYVSDSITLNVNEPPNAPTVAITPDPAYTTTDLFASATGSEDPDASGSVTYRYVWFVDGVEVPDVTGAEFPAASTDKNHVYRVEVFASDGLHESAAGTAERTVSNTAPKITDVTITPDAAPIGTELTCAATTDDDDDDPVDLTYSWSDGTVGATTTIGEDAIVGDILTCTATANDGDEGTATDTASATVTNTPPVMTDVTVSPDSGRVGDILVCEASATDDDGDAITYSYAWSTGAEDESYTITADEDPGDTITCTATATDATGASIDGTVDATVTNTDPAVAVSISPATAAVGETLTCDVTASDADGEEPDVVITWTDGSTGPTYMVTAANDPSSTITCTTTASDTDGGTASDSASATVTNTDPEIVAISVTPSTGAVGDTLTCSATANDADGGEPTITYAWSDGSTDDTLTITSGTPVGSALECTATASDTDGGSDTATASATITNTLSTIDSITVSPVTGQVGDTLTCAASVSDADGDTPSIAYAWSAGTEGETYTITADDNPGDTITCVATVSDADGGTVSDAASATVTNTDPAVAVSISPATAAVGDTLTCDVTASDADGEEPDVVITWTDGSTGPTYMVTATNDPSSTITCTATASDTDGGTASDSASATVTNTDPEIVAIDVTPSTGAVGDTLTCSATATDVDGGEPTITFAWSDGSTGDTITITAGTTIGSALECTATASDTDGGSDTATASAIVTNTLPTIDSVTVSPVTGKVGDTLACAASVSDADGDTPSLSFTWSTGTEGETYTITADDNPGDSLICTATATDSEGGTDTGTATATVTNTAPIMVAVSITPAEPTNDNTLTCIASATDTDGESPTITYSWSTGATGAMAALTSANQPGDEITCTATATDATGATAIGTSSVTVTNRAPTAGSVSISPDGPTASDAVTCTATGSADPDGEDVTVAYTWDIDGSPAGSSASLESGYSKGDTLTCTVVATDASGSTDTITASVVVANTAPTIDSVTLTPSSLYTNDTVSAVVTTTDADGDAVALSYAFAVNGAVVGTTDSSLSGVSHFDKGDAISVVVTVDDGEATATATSSSITVQNTPPSAPVVSVIQRDDPDDGIAGLLCSVDTPSTDADGDSIAYAIAWDVNGTPYTDTVTSSIPGDTVPFDALDSDQEWTCEATPDDGDESGAMGTGSLYIETMGLPTSEMSFDTLSFSGNLIDYDIMADGSARVLTNTGSEYYVQGFRPDGTPEATVFVGTGSGNWAGVFVSRVSGHTIVVLANGGTLRYTYLNRDYEVLADQVTLWTDGYYEFFDVAIDDTGRAVVMYAAGPTNVAWIDESGLLERTEEAFDISASYGGHVAMNQRTGAGIVASQRHSGDGIYYQRFNADFEWIDPTPVQMYADYHYWYDGYTVGMNDNGDYVFLWWKSTSQMGMAFYDSAGSRVARIDRSSPSWGSYDVFRLRHQEIPLNGDNFVMGETYASGGSGRSVTHFEYTPSGTLVSSDSTSYTVAQGLTIRTDGQGNAVVRDTSTIRAVYSYP